MARFYNVKWAVQLVHTSSLLRLLQGPGKPQCKILYLTVGMTVYRMINSVQVTWRFSMSPNGPSIVLGAVQAKCWDQCDAAIHNLHTGLLQPSTKQESAACNFTVGTTHLVWQNQHVVGSVHIMLVHRRLCHWFNVMQFIVDNKDVRPMFVWIIRCNNKHAHPLQLL